MQSNVNENKAILQCLKCLANKYYIVVVGSHMLPLIIDFIKKGGWLSMYVQSRTYSLIYLQRTFKTMKLHIMKETPTIKVIITTIAATIGVLKGNNKKSIHNYFNL